jgi:methylated-DNA-protein-cysteine methyltransferase-like protein
MAAMPLDPWTRAVYGVVRDIPRGRVATYGMVGLVAGRARSARLVGNIMRACSDPSVPCHRVIRVTGEPAFPRHRRKLRAEGVSFVGDRVDLERHLWRPRLVG